MTSQRTSGSWENGFIGVALKKQCVDAARARRWQPVGQEGRTLTESRGSYLDKRRRTSFSRSARDFALEFPRNFRKKLDFGRRTTRGYRWVSLPKGNGATPDGPQIRFTARNLNLPGEQRRTFSTRASSRPADELWQPGKWLLQLRPRQEYMNSCGTAVYGVPSFEEWPDVSEVAPVRLVVQLWCWTGVEHFGEGVNGRLIRYGIGFLVETMAAPFQRWRVSWKCGIIGIFERSLPPPCIRLRSFRPVWSPVLK